MEKRQLVRLVTITTLALITAVIAFCYLALKGSMPIIQGELKVKGLLSGVTIEKDALGIPTISGSKRSDVAFATGFTHAQDRFFQMDLLRRKAAGELSELFGRAALEADKQLRQHQFRLLAKQAFTSFSDAEKSLIRSYTDGVNAGLSALKARPFEYFLLGEEPRKWQEEDSLLVAYNLFLTLQDPTGELDLIRGTLFKTLPEDVYNFFFENGSPWETALDGSKTKMLAIPPMDSFGYLYEQVINESIPYSRAEKTFKWLTLSPEIGVGSNQFALSGKLTRDGKALLANDMHLQLSVPNIWYRLAIEYQGDQGERQGTKVKAWGVSIPGIPFIIVGSTEHIAWGFTNSYVDTSDLVEVELDPKDASRYLTPKGTFPVASMLEVIKIRGEAAEELRFDKTIFGPILAQRYFGKPVSLSWVAHDPLAFNMRLMDLETASSVKEAIEKSRGIKTPLLNFLVADADGHIGWTLMGSLPKRRGFNGQVPTSSKATAQRWEGLMDAHEYPSLIDPESGMLFTANNRVVGAPWDKFLGSSGYLNGIRAWQIQNDLSLLKAAVPEDLLAIQLDDRAYFFDRWAEFLLNLLERSPVNAQRIALKAAIQNWDGRAHEDSYGFYWVVEFRKKIMSQLLSRLFSPALSAWPEMPLDKFDFEEPVWLILTQRPDYLMDTHYFSWDEEWLAKVDELVSPFEPDDIQNARWGEFNRLVMQHPFSLSGKKTGLKGSLLGDFLNMPNAPLSGEFHVPRYVKNSVSASQRMVASPGNLGESLFEMPGGQSGHPLSPHYKDQLSAWLNGEPTPFLPGPAASKLKLSPL